LWLDQRTRTAEERQHRAEEGEQAVRAREHGERVLGARNAAGRGDWETAVRLYDEAIQDDWPDSPQLRAERLRGRFPLNQQDLLRTELDELLARDDLGPAAGLVKLLRADCLMAALDGRNEGQ